MNIPILSTVLNAVISPVNEYLKGKQRKEELHSAVVQRKIELISQTNSHKALWEIEQVRSGNTSWKDEYVTLLFSLPAILCFLNPEVVNQGFVALEASPEWYQYSFLTVMLAAVGVKMTSNLFKFFKRKA